MERGYVFGVNTENRRWDDDDVYACLIKSILMKCTQGPSLKSDFQKPSMPNSIISPGGL